LPLLYGNHQQIFTVKIPLTSLKHQAGTSPPLTRALQNSPM
jgi:hypothetical protein